MKAGRSGSSTAVHLFRWRYIQPLPLLVKLFQHTLLLQALKEATFKRRTRNAWHHQVRGVQRGHSSQLVDIIVIDWRAQFSNFSQLELQLDWTVSRIAAVHGRPHYHGRAGSLHGLHRRICELPRFCLLLRHASTVQEANQGSFSLSHVEQHLMAVPMGNWSPANVPEEMNPFPAGVEEDDSRHASGCHGQQHDNAEPEYICSRAAAGILASTYACQILCIHVA